MPKTPFTWEPEINFGFMPSPTDPRDVRYALVAPSDIDVPESYSFEEKYNVTLPRYEVKGVLRH